MTAREITAREIRRNYSALLRTHQYRQYSDRKIQERGSCFECGSEDNLVCHHAGYRNGVMPWEYEDDEIVVLCRACHEEVTMMADKLWNNALRYLSKWEIYEMAKGIKLKAECKVNDE